ncbi:MAG: ATP-dependent zinc metalloprotease FtsH [Clostridia bacterium]|jgi:cell division protease FtsH|nr:ATP-dependent zinc metalloprotease FtsH [Clostridia bacterium]
MRRKNAIRTLITYIALIALAIWAITALDSTTTKEMSYTELMQKIETEDVKSIELGTTRLNAKVILKDEENITRIVDIPSSSTFIESVQDRVTSGQFELTVAQETMLETLAPYIPNVLLLLGTLFILMFVLRKTNDSNNKAMDFGKSRAQKIDKNSPKKVTFKDVAGLDEEKEELKEEVEFLKNPKKYIDMGARIPKGILLVGHPGNGKTLLAKAVAGEANVPFFSISGSDFVEMFVGVGASRVRDMFKEAKANSPCIIFIDEIDAVGRQRGAGLGGGHDEREQTLNQLLVEMDGFATHESIIVMAATNRPDILDPALLRPGRFDRQIVVGSPDVKAREEILNLHAKNKPFVEGIDFKVIAKNTAGFSGADLENMINEAALLAARKNKTKIDLDDVEAAMVKVMMGPEKKSKVITEKEKKLTAYHEAGHAVVARFLPNHDDIHEISIIPRGMAGGYTMYRPTEDKSYVSKAEMKEQIVSLLGGRMAEKLILDDISTGASNDIERATKIAKQMVMKYGMSDTMGPIMYGSSQEEVFLGRDMTTHSKDYSEQTAAEIDKEVKAIIMNAYKSAENILKDNVDKLHAVAKVLIEKEKITGEEFDAIFRGEDILAKVKEEKKKAEEAKAEENKNEEKVEEKKEDKKEEENK